MYPGSNATQEISSWECRAWIPEPAGYDPEGDCPTLVVRKRTFKAATKDEALRKAADARQRGLLSIHVYGPHMATRVSYVSWEQNEEIKAAHRQEAQDNEKRLKESRVPTVSELVRQNITAKEERVQVEPLTTETERQNLKRIEAATQPSNDPQLYVKAFVLGDLRICDVDQHHLQEFVDSLSRTKSDKTGELLSPKYIRNIVGTFASAWSLLEADPHYKRYYDRLRFSSRFLRYPKPAERRPNRMYSPEEVESLIANCADDFERAFLALCLTGMRAPGEVAGCKWSDLFDHKGETFIRVVRQVQEIKGRFHVKDTKTGPKGERTLPIPKRLVEMIEPVKRRAETLGSEFLLCGHVGTGPSKGCSSPNALQERFNKIKVRAEITREGATLYALRHTVLSAVLRVHGTDAAKLVGGHTTSVMLDKHYNQNRSEDRLAGTAESLPWASVQTTENSVGAE